MGSLRFSWQSPVERTDGTQLSDEEINALSYTLYEDDVPVVEDIAAIEFELLMDGKPEKQYKYAVTASLYRLESPQSEPVFVNFIRPTAPMSFGFSWIG